ncbi:MAG: sarcosine oxidase subunit gamma family protein [Pseudomonadota bacterium]
MSEPQTVLAGATASEGLTVTIEEQGPTGMITLRGDLSSPALIAAVKEGFGAAVPATLTAAFNGDQKAVWMSPDELLLFCPYANAPAKAAALGQALAGEHHMAVDVSDTRAVILVTGRGAQELMAKGAPLDLSDKAFPIGTARRTHFAEIAVGIWRTGDEAWEIVCFQSYAQHLFDWLVASSGDAASVGYF